MWQGNTLLTCSSMSMKSKCFRNKLSPIHIDWEMWMVLKPFLMYSWQWLLDGLFLAKNQNWWSSMTLFCCWQWDGLPSNSVYI